MSSKIYTSPCSNFLQRNGFIMVSNLLFDYQDELGITKAEFDFLLRVMKNKSFAIHDRDLDPSVCTRTLSRRRNSLRDKGYLNFSTIKEQDPITGTFSTSGISYDLSPLEAELQRISDKIEKTKENKINELFKDSNYVVEESDDSPLDQYIKDYKKVYGTDYKVSDYEIKKYNSLSETNKQMIAYIFRYCADNNLFGSIIPRLTLFFKTDFRFADLKKYCLENGYIRTQENKIEDNSELIEEVYNSYYPEGENKVFKKAVERIINRYAKDGKLPDGIEKILDKSFDDTYNHKTGVKEC